MELGIASNAADVLMAPFRVGGDILGADPYCADSGFGHRDIGPVLLNVPHVSTMTEGSGLFIELACGAE
ncbi:hypothetical protein EBN03_19000 [Nocardia stercoris]|uniref:Uncharacterized protein n=1 Tax=Nocardia stercoris TaxID=2483361 RepID=A0A3M2L4I5_9NOCA|nr:hypothetical protein EBN03_19000 [Nocardia stercoris]